MGCQAAASALARSRHAPPSAHCPCNSLSPAFPSALPALGRCPPPSQALAAPKRQRTHVLQENMGTSLLEYFTEQQIQTHVQKLQKKEGQVQGE